MIIYIHRHIQKTVPTGTIPIEQDSKLEMNVPLHNMYYKCVQVTTKFKTVQFFWKVNHNSSMTFHRYIESMHMNKNM